MKRGTTRLIGALLLAVLLYAAFVLYAGYRDIEASLARFQPSTFVLALGLSSANYLLRYLKWEYYLARLHVTGVGKLDSLLVFLSGFVLTITPGKVGEVFKSAVLRRTHGVPIARTAPIIVAERLTDVIGVIALILVGSTGFRGGLPWAAAGGVCVLVGLGVILWERPSDVLLRWVGRQPRFSDMAPKLDESLRALRRIASPAALAWPIVLSVAGWGCEGVALWLLLQGFGAPAPLPLCVFFYATASLAGALIPVPGGLGVVEAMIQEQLVRLAHVPQAPATASMILIRVATLWWAVIVGFVALAILQSRHPALRREYVPAPAPPLGETPHEPEAPG
jgi:glycosyltransferase 2 family protein